MEKRSLHVMMLGLWDFSERQGVMQSHLENLCPGLIKSGCKVTLLTCCSGQPKDLESEWKDVNVIWLWKPKLKSLKGFIHAFLSIFYVVIKKPDILHIHATCPGFMAPVAQFLGLRVVVTHHGYESNRSKWTRPVRYILKASDRFVMRHVNAHIVVSETIRQQVLDNYAVDSIMIPNGVNLPDISNSTKTLDRLRLSLGCYILLVSQMLVEKRHSDLIQAFIQAKLIHWKLVLVSDFDQPNTYAQSILDEAKSFPNIVCTGFQSKDVLNELYSHASIFVLPSSHENLPMDLQNALSYGLPILCSDIPVNKEIGVSSAHYFSVGNIDQLTMKLKKFYRTPFSMEKKIQLRHWVKNKYNWDNIIEKTLGVYLSNIPRRG